MGWVRNAELEAAIRRDPSAIAPCLVYADWLLEKGSDHGRLIALQHALETSPTNDTAHEVEELRLIERLVGGPLDETVFSVEWSRGFVRAFRIPWEGEPDGAGVLQRLLESPVSLVLQDLSVGIYAGADDAQRITELLTTFEPPLTRLAFGEFASPTADLNGISWLELGDLSRLWNALPGLRDLMVQGIARLGVLDLPELERFELRSGCLGRAQFRSVLEARWPALRELKVWFGDGNYGAECDAASVEPLLAGRGLANLRTLGLMNAEFADDLCRLVPKARVLPQLEVLDLSMGTLSDDGARVLLENRAAFAHLKELNLEKNCLSEALLEPLKQLCANVRVGDQRDAEDRYVAVGE